VVWDLKCSKVVCRKAKKTNSEQISKSDTSLKQAEKISQPLLAIFNGVCMHVLTRDGCSIAWCVEHMTVQSTYFFHYGRTAKAIYYDKWRVWFRMGEVHLR
jgi:hypothetical protein